MALCALVAVALAVMYSFSNQDAETSLSLSDRVAYVIAPFVNADFENMDAAGQRAVLDSLTYPIRKCAHVAEYAVLGVLVLALMRTVAARSGRNMRFTTCAATAAVVVTVCAGADELHQLFVAGRSTELADVCIDVCGAALGMTVYWLVAVYGKDGADDTNNGGE